MAPTLLDLPGPSRRIRIEPLQVPATAPPPAREAPPSPVPPSPTPEREPAPA